MIVIIACGFCVATCAAYALRDVNRRERDRTARTTLGPERREGGEV